MSPSGANIQARPVSCAVGRAIPPTPPPLSVRQRMFLFSPLSPSSVLKRSEKSQARLVVVVVGKMRAEWTLFSFPRSSLEVLVGQQRPPSLPPLVWITSTNQTRSVERKKPAPVTVRPFTLCAHKPELEKSQAARLPLLHSHGRRVSSSSSSSSQVSGRREEDGERGAKAGGASWPSLALTVASSPHPPPLSPLPARPP